MWESPIYKIRKRTYDKNGKEKTEEITIDVTGSAPNMSEPGELLERVFQILTKDKNPKKTNILDVGAAKLRNTIYLLKKGFKVYSVEFPELYKRMNQAKTNLDLAKRYNNFKKLVFPKDFFKLKDKIDIALLINVTNVMPIPLERLILLALCREKLKENGLLLWYNWRDISSNPEKYTEATKINDGYFKGKGRKYKTFHGEWNKEHVFEILISSGFSHNKNIKLGNVSTNQAYVFSANSQILLQKSLDLEEIKRGGKKRDPKKIMEESSKLHFPSLYLKELKLTKPGKEEAKKFHQLSTRLLATIFDYQLKNPTVEKEINERRGRIDIKFQNKNQPGFFKNIKDLRDIKCPSVFVECKNYTYDIRNPEFAQLADRLNKIRGMLGILVCRMITDKEKVIKHCQDRLKDDKYIIVLDDDDMEKLVKLKIEEGNEAIDDFMENKINEIVD